MEEYSQYSPEIRELLKLVAVATEKAGAQAVKEMETQIARTLAGLWPQLRSEIEPAITRAMAPLETNYAELRTVFDQLKTRAERLEGEFAEVRAAVRNEADEAIARIRAERDRGRP